MPDLWWREFPDGTGELRRADGTFAGQTRFLWNGGARGYAVAPDTTIDFADHSTEADARAWVEDRVRIMGGGDGA